MAVLETYNGEIANMRRQGYTLQAIGDTVGVSRERIRQILFKYYPGVKMSLLPENQMAKVIGCLPDRLTKLRTSGMVNPKHLGKFYLYSTEDMGEAMLALQRNCSHCGAHLPLKGNSRKYCPECSRESRRYHYPFMSEEAKKKDKQAKEKYYQRIKKQAKEVLSG